MQAVYVMGPAIDYGAGYWHSANTLAGFALITVRDLITVILTHVANIGFWEQSLPCQNIKNGYLRTFTSVDCGNYSD